MQVGAALVAVSLPLGAIPIPWFDGLVLPSVSPPLPPITVTVVRTELVPVTDRIYFGKARLATAETFATTETFTPQGTSVSEPAKRMLQRSVGALNLSEKRCASVVLHGFASDEEFQNLSGSPSHLKNLQLADHRAQAVSDKLSCFPEAKSNWLTVEVPNRWTPAINESLKVEEAWKKMSNKRKCLVQQPKKQKRDAQLDRVVVLEWKLDQPCKDSAANGATETESPEESE